MAQRYQRRSEQPQYNPIDIEQSMYPMEALRGAPLPTDPLAGALATARGNPEVMGGPPMTEADFTPQIPASWKEAAVMGGLMAAPVMGQAAWKMRGVPKDVIEALKAGEKDPVHGRIAGKPFYARMQETPPVTSGPMYHGAPYYRKDQILAEGLNEGSWYAKSPKETLPFAQRQSVYDPYVIFEVDRSQIKPTSAALDDPWGQAFGEARIFTRAGNRVTPSRIIKEVPPR